MSSPEPGFYLQTGPDVSLIVSRFRRHDGRFVGIWEYQPEMPGLWIAPRLNWHVAWASNLEQLVGPIFVELAMMFEKGPQPLTRWLRERIMELFFADPQLSPGIRMKSDLGIIEAPVHEIAGFLNRNSDSGWVIVLTEK